MIDGAFGAKFELKMPPPAFARSVVNGWSQACSKTGMRPKLSMGKIYAGQNNRVGLIISWHDNDMETGSNVLSASSEPSHGAVRLLRFWASFLLCLVVLGLISGLMLAGLFVLMGYRMF
jgi:hypothetical protein